MICEFCHGDKSIICHACIGGIAYCCEGEQATAPQVRQLILSEIIPPRVVGDKPRRQYPIQSLKPKDELLVPEDQLFGRPRAQIANALYTKCRRIPGQFRINQNYPKGVLCTRIK